MLENVELARENVRLVTALYEKNRELRDTLDMLERAEERVVHAERLAAIGRMIAMIVHDLRSPIRVIHAAASEIRSQAGENHAPLELASEVLEETKHMRRTRSDLLDTTQASEWEGTLVEDEVIPAALANVIEEAARVGIQVDLDLA